MSRRGKQQLESSPKYIRSAARPTLGEDELPPSDHQTSQRERVSHDWMVKHWLRGLWTGNGIFATISLLSGKIIIIQFAHIIHLHRNTIAFALIYLNELKTHLSNELVLLSDNNYYPVSDNECDLRE